ncbi:MAG: TVP38/TMEM64 family protein [Firmicutes bacterium]|nr:TVP38/TMEM64 family protein [Bacillota bacterium]
MDKIKYLSLGSFLLIIFLFFLCGPRWTGLSLPELLSYTPESPVLASLVFLGVYCLKAFVMFIPLTVLYIAAGVIFPWWWAILLTYLCLMVETTIGYLIGRWIGRRRVHALINRSEYGKKLMNFGTNHSIFSSLIVRMIPGPPIELTNMFIGTTGIKYHHFIIGTLLGYTPGMVPLVLMGKAAPGLLSPEFLIHFLVIVGLFITLLLAGGYLWQKTRRRRSPE